MTGATYGGLACVNIVEMLTDHLEGALGPAEAAAVHTHLARCAGCARYLDQMRLTIRALGLVPVETLPAASREALLAAFARGGEPDR